MHSSSLRRQEQTQQQKHQETQEIGTSGIFGVHLSLQSADVGIYGREWTSIVRRSPLGEMYATIHSRRSEKEGFLLFELLQLQISIMIFIG